MTHSLINQAIADKTTLQIITSKSGMDEDSIKTLFEQFDIGILRDENGIETELKAHRNLIEDILDITHHPSNIRIFSQLSAYKDIIDIFNQLNKASPALSLAPGIGLRNNPVEHLYLRPLAALVMMEKDKTNSSYSSIYTLSLLVILIARSKPNMPEEHKKKVIRAAHEIRSAAELGKSGKDLSIFNEKLEKINNIHQLLETLRNSSEIKDNDKSNSVFSAVKQIVDFVPTKRIKHFQIKEQSSFLDPADASDTLDHSPIVFSHDQVADEDPENQSFVFTSNDSDAIQDIPNETISREITKEIDKKKLKSFTNELQNIKNDISVYQNTSSPIRYLDNDFNKFSTNLYNSIERRWLTEALKTPNDFESDEKTALLIGLSICTNIHYTKALNFILGDDGDITWDGSIRRKIPDIENAIRPDEHDQKLYIKHINDQTNPFVYLPLPRFIVKILKNISDTNSSDDISLLRLFEQSGDNAGELVKKYIGEINERYGQRFNTNRLSGQLKQYVKSEENDPCITYALFGHEDQRPPSAFYYRSITLSRLINKYEKLVNRYFHEE